MASLVNSTKYLKKNKHQYFSNSFKKIEKKQILAGSFYEVSITLIPKTHKDTKRKKTVLNISNEHRYKIPQ